MSKIDSKIKASGNRHLSRVFSALAVRLWEASSETASKFAGRLRRTEAAELLEFALALPLILAMVVGLLDFSHAYNLKQKLANAAREGARIGGSESMYDLNNPKCSGGTVPCSVETIKDDVTTYLKDAGIDTTFIGSASYNLSTFTCTYYTTSGGKNYGLQIERNVPVTYTDPNNSKTVTVPSTRVTLYYPYDWTFGFDQVIKLLIPSSTFTDPIRLETDAIMANP